MKRRPKVDVSKSEMRDWQIGVGASGGDFSVLQILDNLRTPPSGKRHVSNVAATISSGVHPSKQGIPQLVPDFVTPEMHVQMAQAVRHPFSLPVSVHQAVRKAMESQPEDPGELHR